MKCAVEINQTKLDGRFGEMMQECPRRGGTANELVMREYVIVTWIAKLHWLLLTRYDLFTARRGL
jgi:hypothetical protein